jgi:uncharacterized protein YjdB
MPFTFKLSQRLARMRCHGLMAAAATLAACEKPLKVTGPTPPQVTQVIVSPNSVTLQPSQGVQLTATLKDASGSPLSGRVVNWASSNATAASVNGSGLVSGVATGSATITATSEGQTGLATVTVTTEPVASVVMSPVSASVAVGQTVQLTATPKDASGNPLGGRVVTWASSKTAVAAVNGSGLVTGVAAGAAIVTATSEGKSGTAAIAVTTVAGSPGTVSTLAVAGVTGNSATLSFTEVSDGTGLPASYFVRFAVAPLVWNVATDVAQGTCTVPMAGTAIGATRSCTVLGLQPGMTYQFQLVAFRGTLNVDAVFGGLSNVVNGTTTASTAPVASVTVSPATASVAVGRTQQFTAMLRDASGNLLSGRAVTWTSGSAQVATVSGSGLATGLGAGTATITAASEGQSGAAAVTVTTGSGEPPLNEPAGFRAYNDQPWDLLTGNGWSYLRRTSSKDATIIADAAAPHSPVNMLEIIYTPDMAPSSEPSVHWIGLPSVKAIYTAWWIKLSPNWINGPAGAGKMTFLWTNGVGQVYTGYYHPCVWPAVCNPPVVGPPYRVGANTEWAPYGQQVWFPNVATTWINPGEWHRIEFFYRWETTPGVSGDGIIRWWVDGILNGDYTNVHYPADAFIQFEFAPTVEVPGPVERYMYIDHTYVSTP